jgi:CCR4-NOT transcription complex subunit 6
LQIGFISCLSFSCFVASWKEHSKRHSNLRKISSLSETASTPPNENEDNDDDKGPPVTSISSTSVDHEQVDEWTMVSQERVYTPKTEDIGTRLRLDVYAVSNADNTVLTGPTTLFTEPVLSAPTKPPKRALQTIPGSGSGISGAVRFRIVSYNILAELYATKQVSLLFIYVSDTPNLMHFFRPTHIVIVGTCLGHIDEKFFLMN